MIFVTLGSAVKGIEFTRLINKMDEIAGKMDEEVIMQIGTVPYEPKNAKYFRYASYLENLSYFQKASLVVGHGGTGTILNALRFQIPIVVVPRRHHYGEHVDDHQVELAQRLVGNELIKVVYDIEDLESAVREMLHRGKEVDKEMISPEKETLIKTIKNFVGHCP
jgi:UDP-N-acetylglucosamine transferase subunit ALG13